MILILKKTQVPNPRLVYQKQKENRLLYEQGIPNGWDKQASLSSTKDKSRKIGFAFRGTYCSSGCYTGGTSGLRFRKAVQEFTVDLYGFELYGKGLTTRQIESVVENIYGTTYSKSSISRITTDFSSLVDA